MSVYVKTVPFRASVSSRVSAREIADQFESILNANSKMGWEYDSTHNVSVEISAGCFGAILGQGVSAAKYDVITLTQKACGRSENDLPSMDLSISQEQGMRSSIFASETISRNRITINPKDISVSQTITDTNIEKVAYSGKDNWESGRKRRNLNLLLVGFTLILLLTYIVKTGFGLNHSWVQNKTEVDKIELEDQGVQSIQSLIKTFKEHYRNADFERAHEVLVEIEEQSPGSNFALSARAALDKKRDNAN